MNISIIGASAGIGLETALIALNRNHHVTTLSRSKPNLDQTEKLNSILGSALDKTDVINATKNADAVIVTLGTGKNFKATTLFSDFAKVFIEVQNEIDIQIPFIVVTGFGTGESRAYANWLAKLFLKLFLEDNYKDKAKMEHLITSSNLNWLIVRPGKLTDESRTQQYRIETQLFKGINIGEVSRKNVADYLVKQAENPTELKNYVAISSK